MYSRFEGMMPYLPTKPQAEAWLIEKEKELKRAEEKRRSFQALQDDFRNYLSKYNPQALNQHPPPRDCSPPSPIIQTSPVQPTKPPEPPDLKQSDLISATKGEEELNPNSPIILTTLPHSPQLPDPPSQQKSSRKIIVKDCDGDKEPLEPDFESPGAALPNGEKTPRPISAEDGVATNTCQDNDSSPEKELTTSQVLHQIEVSHINTHHAAHQVFDTMRQKVQKKTSKEAVTLLCNCANNKMFAFVGQANHVWKPGGLCLQTLEMNEDEQPLDYVETLITNAEKQPLDYLVLETVVIDEGELRSFEEKSLYTKELVETVSSIQEIKLNGVKNVRVLDMVQNKGASQEKELRQAKRSWDLEEFKPFDEKMSDKTHYLEDEQDAENELKEVMRLNSSWSNRVWEPGGVLTKHDEWKCLEKILECESVLCIIQGFLELGIINTIKDFQERIMNDVLSLLSYFGVYIRIFQAGLEAYMLAFVRFRNQKLIMTHPCLEADDLSWFQKFHETSCLLLEMPFVESVRSKAHGNELVVVDQIMKRVLEQNTKGDTPLFTVQQVFLKWAAMLYGLKTSQTACQVWHRWKNKVEIWQADFGLPLLLLVSLQLNAKDYTCYSSLRSKSRHVSTENHIGIFTFNSFENVKGLGSLKILSASYALIKGAVSFAGILHLANVHELFHSPRPPELFLCEVCRWLSHMTELLVQALQQITTLIAVDDSSFS